MRFFGAGVPPAAFFIPGIRSHCKAIAPLIGFMGLVVEGFDLDL